MKKRKRDFAGIPYASVKKRLMAFVIDYLIISAYLVLLFGVGMILVQGKQISITGNSILLYGFDFAVLVLPVILYFTLEEYSSKQGSVGKQRARIRVIDLGGGKLSFGQALARNFLKLLPWELTHICLRSIPGWPLAPTSLDVWVMIGFIIVWVLILANFILMVFSRKYQTIYDWLMGSVVIVSSSGTRDWGNGKRGSLKHLRLPLCRIPGNVF